MTWFAVGGAVVGVVGSVLSSNAASDATQAQTDSAAAATAEQRRQYDLSRADQAPFLQAGTGALGQMQQLNSGNFSSFHNSPDYQFALSQGTQELDRSAAARGRLDSGGYGQDLTRFGQGLAEGNYNSYYNRLQSMAGQGQTSANNLGYLGENSANQIGGNMMAAGQARASGYINQGNAIQNGLGQFGNAAGQFFGNGGFSQFSSTPVTNSYFNGNGFNNSVSNSGGGGGGGGYGYNPNIWTG